MVTPDPHIPKTQNRRILGGAGALTVRCWFQDDEETAPAFVANAD